MKSLVIKRSIVINGHKTSISLEDQFWSALKEIARQRPKTLSELASEIDGNRGERANLSSAIRLYVLGHFQALCASASNARGPNNPDASRQPSESPRAA
jgi:predicted DNA-binding ribbon-helix-helix protein